MLYQTTLTDRALELLNAIKAQGDWMSRAQLARATGKRALSPHDKDLLERLIYAGLLEKRQRESNTPVGTAYDYRALPQASEE